MGTNKDGLALGEALYWMAEKLTWGYEDVEPDPAEALKLFRQSADLGFSDALIRIGQLQQQGKGTPSDPSAALKNYIAATKAGNFVALAFLANLLSRSSQLEKADALWDRFFKKLEANPEHAFIVAERGELLHDYITTQLQLGFEPEHMEVLRRRSACRHGLRRVPQNAAEQLGRAGDGGVDGVINEDRLGLDRVYVQAKRYARGNAVGRPEVQAFVGSLVGLGATKGVFVTTSTFSPQARDFVRHLSQRVILLDGQNLADLMIEHGVGVRTSRAIEFKRLDEDFFSEDD